MDAERTHAGRLSASCRCCCILRHLSTRRPPCCAETACKQWQHTAMAAQFHIQVRHPGIPVDSRAAGQLGTWRPMRSWASMRRLVTSRGRCTEPCVLQKWPPCVSTTTRRPAAAQTFMRRRKKGSGRQTPPPPPHPFPVSYASILHDCAAATGEPFRDRISLTGPWRP